MNGAHEQARAVKAAQRLVAWRLTFLLLAAAAAAVFVMSIAVIALTGEVEAMWWVSVTTAGATALSGYFCKALRT